MNNQVETKKVRWEDLEIAEEQDHLVIDWVPSLIEDIIANWHRPQVERWYIMPGLGDEVAQVHQALCGEITEWEEGNEPVPTEYKCGVDPAKPGSEFTAWNGAGRAGVLLVFGISAEEFAEATEGLARAALETEIDYLNTPVLDWREANKRLPSIGEMVAAINAFCTPSRNNLTGREE